jgi:molybdopterin-containing oxidoreductase family membrane subunit
MATQSATLRAKGLALPRHWWWTAILILLGLWGLVSWIYELSNGLTSTGMRDVVSWGMYIFSFAFFVGLSAGGLIVASSAEVFGIQALKPLSRLGVLSAAGCITVAALMIIPDLGRPERVLNLFLYPNWTSPLIWDIGIIAAYFLFSVVDLYVLTRHAEAPGPWRRRVRILAYVGLPLAILLHSITAWIFGLQIARSFWNTALMAPLFVTSAILSGTALVTILALCVERFDRVHISVATRNWLRGLLAVTLVVDLFLVGSDYITILWGNVPEERAGLDLILPGGGWSWLFWLEWVVGGAIPLLLLVVPRLHRVPGVLLVAAGLIMAGVLAFRIELIVGGFISPLISYAPGIALGNSSATASSFQMPGSYHPTWVEYGIVVGLFALFAGIVTWGYRRLQVMRGGADDA